MTALIPAPSLTTLQVSPELWRLLSTGPSAQIEEIAKTPALRTEAAQCSRQLELLTEAAGGELVQRSLAPLVLVYGLGEQALQPVFWRVYADTLGDLPRLALERAVSEYSSVGKFFPKPAEIRELAEPHANALRTAASRARRASDLRLPAPMPESERLPAEKVRELLADTLSKLSGSTVLDRTAARRRPSPQAKVDATGVSAEMRALLARQA